MPKGTMCKQWVSVTAREASRDVEYLIDPTQVVALGPSLRYTQERDELKFRIVYLVGGQVQMLDTPQNVRRVLAPVPQYDWE